MEFLMRITRVWLDESKEECTQCGLCQSTCPEVFEVPEKMRVKSDANLDFIDTIQIAAESCPVNVIAYAVEGGNGVRIN